MNQIRPAPAEGSNQLTSYKYVDLLRKLGASGNKEDVRAAASEAAGHIGLMLLRENEMLVQQVSMLNSETRQLRDEYHAADKQVAVLQEQLAAARSELRAMSTVDWLLNSLFAVGGGLFGFGVSWPDLSGFGRGIPIALGIVIVLIPLIYKWAARPKSGR